MMATRSARLRPGDTARVASSGLRTRPLRAALAALGIAIGIAAMVAVVGISTSSREQLNDQLRALGTNMLTVTAGKTLTGQETTLPESSTQMVARISQVHTVSATGIVDDAAVYRNDHINKYNTNGIAVKAAKIGLLDTVGGTVAAGRWLDNALARYPTVVLGAVAADRLGVSRTDGTVAVLLDGKRFIVVGILDPVVLAPELDTAALIGWPVATRALGFDAAPSTVYERSAESAVTEVRSLLPASVDPAHPEQVRVSRPSDALVAQAAADETLTTLLLALGGVALLVGGLGVANTMVIAVLERRSEIGLRRALGATRPHIRRQFLGEAILLAGVGGVGGAVLGGIATAAFAAIRGWPFVLPAWVLVGAAVSTILVGALAGVYPATRAARLSPAAALTTT